ncbi:sugar phosphate isomerase/epimerase family protein [Acuticoccus kandeliae]|uniref:sugar phosphate isomerase/epimerase family protein n=1 Tax=Acuticoccus kandeliae TaxID=2073160 RepID=UPI000D3E4BC6|nr:sugar phosphate isomerase/epimerase family protein [Acuticoccus kandeliae]
MSDPTKIFSINLYAYTFDYTVSEALLHLAKQGYREFELMMFPGHLWPAEMSATDRRELRKLIEDNGLRVVSVNMPNIDLNIAGASKEMREYSLGLISSFTTLAGELGASGVVIGPGKSNPLFPLPKERLQGYFFEALDRLYPLARDGGTKLLVENMPFGYLPDVTSILSTLSAYGNDDIYLIYDVANGHFIGKDPRDELREGQHKIRLVHLSDTNQKVYKHDPVGLGDVPFANVPPVLKEIGYKELPMLEIVSLDPDTDLMKSVKALAPLGY